MGPQRSTGVQYQCMGPQRSTGVQYQCMGPQRSTGVQEYRSTGVQDRKVTSSQIYRCNVQMHWTIYGHVSYVMKYRSPVPNMVMILTQPLQHKRSPLATTALSPKLCRGIHSASVQVMGCIHSHRGHHHLSLKRNGWLLAHLY